MKRRNFFPSLCLIVWAGAAFAQTSQSDSDRSKYETDPAVDPARPTVTNPAHIPPPGYLQFEQGLLQANTTPGGPDSQLSLTQSTKLSLDHHLMVFLLAQPFARSVESGAVSHDPGDLDLGAQIVLLDEQEGRGYIPSIAVSYANVVRSGAAANLDIGSFQRSLLVLASGSLGGFHYDSNFIVNEQHADSPNLPNGSVPRRAQFGQTLSVTHSLTSNLSLTGELWRLSQPLTGGNAIGNLWTAGYAVHRTLVLDGGFSRGLTATSTHWETFVGFSYLLPHRLWPLPRRLGPQS